MGPLIGLILLSGAAFYAYRIAPRVASRMAAATTAAAVGGKAGAGASTPHPAATSKMPTYRAFEFPFAPIMTRREALMVLGFADRFSGPESSQGGGPSDAEVLNRYRSLMLLHHSDVGGSPLMAQKIIEAKDLLIRGGR